MDKKIQLIEITTDDLKEIITTVVKNIHSEYEISANLSTEILTRQQVADIFQISMVSLHDWINKGIIKHYKMGNKTYFIKSEIYKSLKESNLS